MVYNLEEYEMFITGILHRMPLVRAKDLRRALIKTYKKMDEDLASEILLAIQRRGHVLLSSDGWAMTRGAYQRISNDRFNEKVMVNELYRLGEMSTLIRDSELPMETIECFRLVVDMMPVSSDFVVGFTPWYFLFDTASKDTEPCHLYQITKIPADREEARCELIRNLPKADERMQDTLIRIALIENEAHAWMVPHLGFKYIVVLDDETSAGFRVVEHRTGTDIWSE